MNYFNKNYKPTFSITQWFNNIHLAIPLYISIKDNLVTIDLFFIRFWIWIKYSTKDDMKSLNYKVKIKDKIHCFTFNYFNYRFWALPLYIICQKHLISIQILCFRLMWQCSYIN